ncbi:hypothetical protein X735_11480 [Mesorhizobium sp. L2C085B000]|nr:hypothetical protein X735_11480 [Mesorhizobium sp. L2C085B000]
MRLHREDRFVCNLCFGDEEIRSYVESAATSKRLFILR